MSTDEEIFVGGKPMRVTVEFEGSIPLKMAEALFLTIRGRNSVISGQDSVDFEVMYAGELATVLIALDESGDNNYTMQLRWTEGRTGVYILVMRIY
jgi:hypothetical protein